MVDGLRSDLATSVSGRRKAVEAASGWTEMTCAAAGRNVGRGGAVAVACTRKSFFFSRKKEGCNQF